MKILLLATSVVIIAQSSFAVDSNKEIESKRKPAASGSFQCKGSPYSSLNYLEEELNGNCKASGSFSIERIVQNGEAQYVYCCIAK